MAIPFKPTVACMAATAVLGLPAPAALASDCCVTMSSSTSELTTLSGAAHAFAPPGQFLVQTGINWRDVTGSYNERGDWTPKPRGSSLSTIQGSLGISYFPHEAWSLGLQLPMAANRLHHAQWGALGALGPLDDAYGNGPLTGGGLGDLTLQASAVAYRGEGLIPSLAFWGGLVLPSGNSAGSPADFTGSGLTSGQIGLSLMENIGPVELTASLGYQRPLTRPPAGASTAFTLGQVATGQLQASVELLPGWRLGLGASGYKGTLASADNGTPDSQLGKVKLMPSVEWRFTPTQGLKAAYGGDPSAGPRLNAMTDQTLFLLYYRYL